MIKRYLAVWKTSGLMLAATTAVVFSTHPNPTQAAGLLTPGDPNVTSLGAEIYVAECAVCHGANLEGQPNWRVWEDDGLLPTPPHDASGHTWHHDDQTLFILTKHGLAGVMETPPQSGMPAFDGVLTDDQIIAVLSYIKSTWPEDLQAHHNALNARSDRV